MDHQLTEQEIRFCDQADQLQYTAMKLLIPTSAHGMEEKLYILPPINNLLPHKNSTSAIHATCYATIDMDHVLSVNVDSQNPKIHYSLSDSFMNQPVGCSAKKEVKSVDC